MERQRRNDLVRESTEAGSAGVQSAAIRDAMLKMGMTEGWSQSLERLEELLAKA